jgi:hypothetical protein
MKFGVREICDVTFKALQKGWLGNMEVQAGQPVLYIDSAKTSTIEGAATTVYATGGRGNARLMAWEGERTLTFTMEDALISPVGFSILTGAGLIDGAEKSIYVHTTERTKDYEYGADGTVTINLGADPADSKIYVMVMDGDDVKTEPFIAKKGEEAKTITINTTTYNAGNKSISYEPADITEFAPVNDEKKTLLVDYYVEKKSGTQQIDITPDKFGGNFYLEASTLFKNQAGVDMPAEFIIPNCKIQSNFTFTMAGSGDPSTFTFTMDAFPDYTAFDDTKKVLASIQIVGEATGDSAVYRESTAATYAGHKEDSDGIISDGNPDTLGIDVTKEVMVSGKKYTLQPVEDDDANLDG